MSNPILSISKYILISCIVVSGTQLSGCSVVSAVATSNRMEEARVANTGKQLVPKDGQTYLIPIGAETVSYLGSGDTDFKINTTAFTQPKGSYSIIKSSPGSYTVYANKRVAGGGETTAKVDVKGGEVVCFYIFNPISAPARIEVAKNDVCDPFLRPLRNVNMASEISAVQSSIAPSSLNGMGVTSTVQPIGVNQSANIPLASPAKRLDELNNMLKKGLITPEEYNAKKTEILKTL
jgi:hypothetical protein